MRFDIISVFPDYLNSLELSLMGKARRSGALDIAVHDLRDWTADRHRTVDDTPVGGGAGMVMRPDIWGSAIDSALDEEIAIPRNGHTPLRILAIPSPAGVPLTQEICQSYADIADHIIIACGRYEGIDARVAEHFEGREDVEVFQYSLGDYVLNGGEVAALALVEAVARLVPGVVGNPDSLVEESHGQAGLLEYPNYTRPLSWRGLTVPDLLTSGDHGKVARWRRDQALATTAKIRPDMIRALSAADLDKADRAVLADLGWFVQYKPGPADHPIKAKLEFNPGPERAEEYSALARETFPDACPPYLFLEDIEMFMSAELSPGAFAGYLSEPRWHVVGVRLDGRLVGYSLCGLDGGTGGPQVGAATMVDLSKFYVRLEYRGTGLADCLMAATKRAVLSALDDPEDVYLWLGTNEQNWRARKFYSSHGFTVAGRRTFMVGEQANDDITMVGRVDVAY